MNMINIKEYMEVTPIIETTPIYVCLENGQANLYFKDNYYEANLIAKGKIICSYHSLFSLYHNYSDSLLISISKSQLIDFYINKSAKFQSYGCVRGSFAYEYRNGIIQRGYWSNDDCMVVKVGISKKVNVEKPFHVVDELLPPEQIYQLFMRAAESLFELTFNHKPIERLCNIKETW